MKKYIIKPTAPLKKLEKPYIKGTFVGIIMGLGIMKILNNAYLDYNFGIITGFVILIIGIIIWYWQYREDKLN